MTPITCTPLGHATALVEIGTSRFLTDPHFGRRVLCFRRRHELPFDPATLSELVAILISHNHADHLDVNSFRFIPSNVPVIVPEETARKIAHLVENPIIELSPFATHRFPDGSEVTAIPVRHRAGRLFPRPTSGYIVRSQNRVVFFCGDSAYGDHFRELQNLAAIDLALLPISGYSPRWIMRFQHMTPAEAVTAFEDLGAKHWLPIGWGTFRLSAEPLDSPIAWLKQILSQQPELSERVHIRKPGESVAIP